MAGPIGSTLSQLPQSTPASTGARNTGIVPPALQRRAETGSSSMILVPAGIFGSILGGLAGTIGEVTGGYFGNKELGKSLGEAAGPLITHFSPFEVYAPSVAPQSTGPDGAQQSGPDESVVVVPAGFLTGLLGGVGGGILGGAVGGLFGNKSLGSDIGSGVGGAIGSVFGPFSVAPATNASDGAASDDEPMVVVPAGFFGDLIGATAGSIGNLVAGHKGQQVGEIAGHLAQQLIPWSAVPPQLSPASNGADGDGQPADLVVVPAGWFSSVLKSFGTVISSPIVRNLAAVATASAGPAAAGAELVPFHAVPQALVPQSASQPGATKPEDTLMVVPAGLFGSLLGSLGGTLGGAVGGLFGNSGTGKAVGDVVGQLGRYLPFSVVAPDA